MLSERSMIADLSPLPRPAGCADELIAALDRRCLGGEPSGKVVYVLGVHSDGRDLWIQIALSEDGRDNWVLHLLPGATAQDAMATLQSTQLRVGPDQRVISVPHRA